MILPILTGIGAALGIGTTAYGLSQSGGGQPQPDMTQPLSPKPAEPTPAAAGATESADRAKQALLARNQLPGLEDQTGGSLSPDAYNLLSSEQAGVFGNSPATTNPGSNFLDLASSSPTGPNNLPLLLQQLQGMQGLTSGASITGG